MTKIVNESKILLAKFVLKDLLGREWKEMRCGEEAIMPEIKEIIKEMSPSISKAFNNAAKYTNEANVRSNCNKAIQEFVDKAGLKIECINEYSVGRGRIDSKWGDVFIEYKSDRSPSGKITEDENAPGTKAVIEQIKSRFIAFVNESPLFEEDILKRLFGVGLDGNTIVYVRNINNNWDISVLPVTQVTVEKLLYALVSVDKAGLRYTPENLASDFGAESEVAINCVNALYKVLEDSDNPKVETLFKQWKIHFGEVCGYDIEGNSSAFNELAKIYHLHDGKPAELLFAVQTYYAIFMKLLAAEIINAFTGDFSEVRKLEDAADYEILQEIFKNLENGGLWKQKGYTNFLEGNIFLWYTDVWSDELARTLREMIRKLSHYDPVSLSTNPKESQDLLKKLYHDLLPRSVRHNLGEYYTPDWLAEYVLDEIGYDGNPDKRILDPACGSGTFLVLIIKRIRQWYSENRFECGFSEAELIKKIAKNVIGFDLNPLAVLAARTNYIVSIRSYLKQIGGIEIPVYLADSISTPAEKDDLFKKHYLYLTIAPFKNPLKIPMDIAFERETLAKYASILESCLADYDADEFIERCEVGGLELQQKNAHRELFKKLQDLHKTNKNGVWARIIKNFFAPLFVAQKPVDYIAGNPPWVNWENLPEDYRDKTKIEWVKYGLFSLKGQEARLGGGKKDLSMIFTYSCVDNYLKMGGKLGFVITQSVFKTKGAGDGFRNFFYDSKKGRIYLKPLSVADMSSFQPFYGATNRTAVIAIEKTKKKFDYPINYTIWKKTVKGKISPEEEYAIVKKITARKTVSAIPVDEKKLNSPWLTAPTDALKGIKKVIGKSDDTAHAGCSTWLNGVYWVEVLEKFPNGNLLIRNLHNVGKIKVKKVEAVVEPDFVYPLLRGRDVKKWIAKESCSILMVQDPDKRVGIPEYEMKINWPNTFDYFTKFEDILRRRPGFKKYFKETDAFYTMYNVTTDTMSPVKVMWRQMITKIRMVVVDEGDFEKMPMTQHVVSFVGFEDSLEANYFCSMGNSSPVSLINECYSTGKSFGAPHILKYIGIPKFDSSDERHIRLAELSEKCHAAAKTNDTETIEDCEKEIDQIAADIWGITDKELKAIQEAIKK
ncbi:N-6 DNA methylase [bacterium]|nr:N-6 DNA methylase [bacterium]